MPNTNPSASPSRSPSPPQQQPQHHEGPQQHRLKVHTHHCRFCNHLLLATTRTIATLPRRKPPAQDNALILPLPHADDDDEEQLDEEPDADADAASPEPATETNPLQNPTNETEEQGTRTRHRKKQKHTTILLSTTLPDRKASLIRREDGFEKRRFVRCGRCRVVVGYFLDAVHFPVTAPGAEDGGEGERIDQEQEPRVVYLLPGALVETEDMGDEEKMRVMDREWSGWISQ
ncbi:hypothetical protein CFD26_103050 [Aspergillus turcosus]|uniref:STEEP1 domain-containing protein n=1 Tax=Aspergillus turcosus TaxID=1245748 RepID=A0A3R7IGT1_9EURO|nr:hypothetical protein CFD26_103050 [Aspergillus turcosus]